MNKRRAAAGFAVVVVVSTTAGFGLHLVLDRTGNLVGRELGGLKEARLASLIRPLF